MQTGNLIDSSARRQSPCGELSNYTTIEIQNITSHTEESSAINKSCTV